MYYEMNNGYAYLSLAMAENMFLAMPKDPSWNGATDAEKMAALCYAARIIDALPLSNPSKNPSLPLKFPLANDLSDEVPEEVIAANMIEAIAILSVPFDTRQSLIAAGVKSVSIGDIHETYDGGNGTLLRSRLALSLLRPWLLSSCSIL